MIGFKVKEYLNNREFTFTEVMNLDDLQEQIINEIAETLTKQQKIDIVWDIIHKESGTTFNRLIDIYARAEISKITRETLVEKLDGAAVTFNNGVETVSKEPAKIVEKEIAEVHQGDKDIAEAVDELTPLKEKANTLKDLVKANKEPMSVDEMKREGLI